MPRVEPFESRVLPSTALHAIVRPQPSAITGPLTPLTDLTGTYQGADGGLYGGDSNTPPPYQAAALLAASGRVVARDGAGRPSPKGKVVVLAIGQSTTLLEFNVFQGLVRGDATRNPDLVFVNGAQNGQVLQNWSGSNAPWRNAIASLRASGLTPAQVQVVWIDLAQIYASAYGDFNARTAHYAALMTKVIQTARRDFPNLQVAYLSSRIYGGYGPQGVDPEPYAYESGFGVRQTVGDQIAGDPALNDDPSRGRVVAPVIAWGPYAWADGATPRADGFSWRRGDFLGDGVHPSYSGQLKASQLLLDFLDNDPSTQAWYH